MIVTCERCGNSADLGDMMIRGFAPGEWWASVGNRCKGCREITLLERELGATVIEVRER